MAATPEASNATAASATEEPLYGGFSRFELELEVRACERIRWTGSD
jgi:hypothetical protein